MGNSLRRVGPRRKLVALVATAAAAAVTLVVAVSPGLGASSSRLAGSPIKVMTVASVNYNGPNFKNILEAARIYGDWINAHGGINGHPLQVTTCDDKGQPSLGVACARQAIAQKMVAIVGSFTFSGANMVPVLHQANVPWFGICCPVAAPEFADSISFPLGSGLGVVAGQAYLAGKICKHINLLDLDYPGAAFIETLTKNILKSEGASAKFGVHVKIPLAVGGDLSPAVAQVTSNTDCVISGLGEANWAAFLPALAQSGVTKVKFFGAQGNLDAKVAAPFAALTNGWVVAGIYPDLALPIWNDYRSAIKTYKADPKQDYNSLGGLGTWAAYVAFTNIAKKMTGDVTNTTFLDAANKTTNLTTGGLTPTINFTKPWTNGLPGFNRVFNRAVAFEQIKNGKIVPYLKGFYDLTNPFLGKPIGK